METKGLELLKKAFLLGFMASGEGFNGEMTQDRMTATDMAAGGGDWGTAVQKKLEGSPGFTREMGAAMEKLAPVFAALLESRELRGAVSGGAGSAPGGTETPISTRTPRSL